MLRKSIPAIQPLHLIPNEQRKCQCIASYVFVQCLFIIMIGFTILNCTWRPNLLPFDPYRLASIMYLYDKGVCEFSSHHQIKTMQSLVLSNDTKGYNVLPIKCEPAIVTVSSRISHTTRKYVKISMMFHANWAILTIAFKCIVTSNRNTRIIQIAIGVCFYSFVFITIFDLSMAIVYITHIKRALTIGMVLRHSGWSVELYFQDKGDFAGYLPMIASACWLRGIVFFALNVYSCKKINDIRFRIKRKLVMIRLHIISQKPIPDPMEEQNLEAGTLYFGPGEKMPYVKKGFAN